jgi:ketosteroid isomerase-like protein
MAEERTTLGNLELARMLYEAQERRDNETIFSIYDEQIVFETPDDGPALGEVHHGHAGVRAFMRDWTGTWSDWHTEVEEAHERGDHVLLIIGDRARVSGSSALIERRYAHLLEFRGGRIIHSRLFNDLKAAFKAFAAQ